MKQEVNERLEEFKDEVLDGEEDPSSKLVTGWFIKNPGEKNIQNHLEKSDAERLRDFSVKDGEKRFLLKANEEAVGVIDLISATCELSHRRSRADAELCSNEQCPLIGTPQLVAPWMNNEALKRISWMNDGKESDPLGEGIKEALEKISKRALNEDDNLLAVSKEDDRNIMSLANLLGSNGFEGECEKFRFISL